MFGVYYFAGSFWSTIAGTPDAVPAPRPKPAPDLYREAVARAGIPRTETLVVEDTPTGIAAAMAAGISVLGFVGASHNTPETPVKLKNAGAFAVIEDMRKLPSVLAAM